MKKFLTVLLVIAVMFTFSFSSAFAAVTTEAKTELQAYTSSQLANYFAANGGKIATAMNYYKNMASYDKYGYVTNMGEFPNSTLSKAVFEKFLDEVALEADMKFAALVATFDYDDSAAYSHTTGATPTYNDIDSQADVLVALNDAYNDAITATLADLVDGGAVVTSGMLDAEHVAELLKAQVKAEKALADEALAKIDPTLYNDNSTTTPYVVVTGNYIADKQTDAAGPTYATLGVASGTYSYKEFVEEVVAKAGDKVNSAVVSANAITASSATTANLTTLRGDVNEIQTAVTNAGYAINGHLRTSTANWYREALPTDAELASDTSLAEAKANAIAKMKAALNTKQVEVAEDIQDKIDAFSQESSLTTTEKKNLAKYQEEKDALAKNVANLEEIFTANINNALTVTAVKSYLGTTSDTAATSANALNATTGTIYSVIKVLGATTAYIDANNDVQVMTADTVKIFVEAQDRVDKVAKATKKAADVKDRVTVDGDTYIDVDDLLAEEIKKIYATGVYNPNFAAKATQNYEVHNWAHELLGYDCNKTPIASQVEVNKKDYDRVNQWSVVGYSTNNTVAVKAIIKDAKAAIKAATTVDAATEAFLDAYAKYDAVLTTADQAKLYSYGGALYKENTNAGAELSAYIDYVINAKGASADLPSAAATQFKNYFCLTGTPLPSDTYSTLSGDTVKSFLYEVNDKASFDAAVAKVKAAADGIKTNKELADEYTALYKKALAIAAPVTAAQKADILAVYDEILAYRAACDMYGYSYQNAAQTLVEGYIATLATAEYKAIKDLEKVLGTVNDITLTDEAKVDEYDALVEAYLTYADDYGLAGVNYPAYYWTTTPAAVDYDTAILNLKIAAAEQSIATLPVNATPAQIEEVRAEVKALGFEGICGIGPTALAKLNKFEQDTIGNEENAKAYVQDLSIKARSTKTSKGVKVTIKADVQPLLDAGFTVEYKFYRSTKSNKNFGTAKVTKTENTYLNTAGKKGTKYYYKAKLVVKNAAGEVVATTPLTQCLYATRTF